MIVMLKYVLFALILYKSVEAYVEIILEEAKPAKFANEEGCYLSKFDVVLKFGVPFTPIDGSNCLKYVCSDTKAIHIEGCGAKALSDNCEKIPGDFTQAFPNCCQKVRCTLPDGKVIELQY